MLSVSPAPQQQHSYDLQPRTHLPVLPPPPGPHRAGIDGREAVDNQQAALPRFGAQSALQPQPAHALGQRVLVGALHRAVHDAAAAPARDSGVPL